MVGSWAHWRNIPITLILGNGMTHSQFSETTSGSFTAISVVRH
jgi:hypothetical protein